MKTRHQYSHVQKITNKPKNPAESKYSHIINIHSSSMFTLKKEYHTKFLG